MNKYAIDHRWIKGFFNKIIFIFIFFLFSSCSHQLNQKVKIKIACSPIPHSEILEVVKEELDNEGVYLDIISIEDYNIPNKLLESNQIDANFFQHSAYLQNEIKKYGYNFSILLPVHIEPLGIYSEKIKNLKELDKDYACNKLVIAVPNDKSNEHRALNFLIECGILRIKSASKDNLYFTAVDVEGCLTKVKLLEVDAAILSRCLPDVDLAVIPANVALLSGLIPDKDALKLENGNNSMYVNVIVIRKEDKDKPEFLKLKEVMNRSHMRQKFDNLYKNQSLKFL